MYSLNVVRFDEAVVCQFNFNKADVNTNSIKNFTCISHSKVGFVLISWIVDLN